MIIIFLLLIILVFLFFSLFIRIYIKADYSFENQSQQFHVVLSIWRITIWKSNMPIPSESNLDMASILEDIDVDSFHIKMDNLARTVKKYNKIMNAMLHQVNLHSLHWSTNLGTGEASSTGVVTGSVWAVKTSAVGLVSNKMISHCQPIIEVNPNYGQEEFQTRLSCMVSIKLGKAIRTILKVIRIYREKSSN